MSTETKQAIKANTFADTISIRPFSRGTENMGLENYGMVVFPNVIQEEQLTCREINGIIRYITGLDEFAPEVKDLPDEEKKAKVKWIRTTVSEIEKELNSNQVNIDDKEFWNKVISLKPNNTEFWGKLMVRCGNEQVFLNPKDPFDRLRIIAIEAGGFDTVAKSYEDADTSTKTPKFYLDKSVITADFTVNEAKTKNKALALLEEMSEKNPEKMFYVVKLIDPSSAHYKKNTPNNIIYEVLDRYINGKFVESSSKKAAEIFINTVNTELAELKLKAILKDATFYRLFTQKPGGNIVLTNTNTVVGRNPQDVFMFLKDVTNQDITTTIVDKIEKEWIK